MSGRLVSVPERPSSVLLVNPRDEDHASLQNLFRGSRWKLQGARTASDGLKAIRRNRYEIPVVICEHCLPDGDWKLMLAELDKAPVRSSLIVSSRLADERLWAEVLNLGAFDLLLSAPFVPEEVLRVTERAWSAWDSAGSAQRCPSEGPRTCPELGPQRPKSARCG